MTTASVRLAQLAGVDPGSLQNLGKFASQGLFYYPELLLQAPQHLVTRHGDQDIFLDAHVDLAAEARLIGNLGATLMAEEVLLDGDTEDTVEVVKGLE